MDKFEEKISELMELSDEEKDDTIEDMKKDCVCPICPTYNECAIKAGEKLFCVLGKSEKCIDKERGCMCPTCPFGQKYGIGVKHNFYCIEDAEMEQRKI
jgi:hypothetical protein